MKRFIYVVLTLIFTTSSFSNILAQGPEGIIRKFFRIYRQNPDRALAYVYETNPTFRKNGQKDIEHMQSQLGQSIKNLGRFYDHELISERELGSNYKLQTFLVRHREKPIRMSFVLYRPRGRWQLQSFEFESAVDDELLEADRIYRLGIDRLLNGNL